MVLMIHFRYVLRIDLETLISFSNNLQFYSFTTSLPSNSSISSFTVSINLQSGTTETYDNNGSEYPVSDSVIVLTPQSCWSGNNLTVVAAVCFVT